MPKRIYTALAVAALTATVMPAAIPFTSTAFAQSSFGRAESRAPRNQQEWANQLDRELRRALRRSDTALNTVARNPMRGTAIEVTIAPDGRVTNVRVLQSRGPAMDQAYSRSLSNMQLAPFTPDMPATEITYTLNLTTKRG